MAPKRDGLVPIASALADLPGPVQAIRKTPPPARRGFTVADGNYKEDLTEWQTIVGKGSLPEPVNRQGVSRLRESFQGPAPKRRAGQSTIRGKEAMQKFALTLVLTLLASIAQAQTTYVPNLVQGDGWSTAIHVFNLCDETTQYSVEFKDSNGELQEFYFDEELWEGFYNDEFGARSINFTYFPPTEEFRRGYVEITGDGGGCVTAASFNVQHHEDDSSWYVVTPAQRAFSSGVMLPFLHFEGCDTQVHLVSVDGGSADIEAFDSHGSSLGQEDLGRISHASFMLSERFSGARDIYGTLEVKGNVSALGLQICGGYLQQPRFAHPLPGASGSPGDPGIADPPGPTFEVVSLSTKYLSSDYFGDHEYSYRLTLRNPTNVAHTYYAELIFRDPDGFLVDRVWVQNCRSLCLDFYRSALRLRAGQTGTLEGVRGQIEFDTDPRDVTVEAAITVAE